MQGEHYYSIEIGGSSLGNITRIENTIDGISDLKDQFIENKQYLIKQLDRAVAELPKPFKKEQLLKDKLAMLEVLNAELSTSAETATIVVDDAKEKPNIDKNLDR